MFSVRLYDVNTFQCFVSGTPKDQHRKPITAVSKSHPLKKYLHSQQQNDTFLDRSSCCLMNVSFVNKNRNFQTDCDALPFTNFQVKFSPNANLFVTSSKDGDIKIWDGVSNKCINSFNRAHDGAEVCSVEFSRNSKVSDATKAG